jgi:hypothetical protein
MKKTARKIHRWVSYLVFAQLVLWVSGGLTFALLPFDDIVKGGAVMLPPAPQELPKGWLSLLESRKFEGVTGISSSQSSQGMLLQLQSAEQDRWLRMIDGEAALPPSEESIRRYAEQMYIGEGEVVSVRFIDESEYRYFGLVDELYGKVDVWQASFSDLLGSRLYFEGDTGRYLAVRNHFWVFYDAMWRLHIMDYSAGKDFNNKLLIFFVVLSFVFALSGLVLTLSSIKRALVKVRRD